MSKSILFVLISLVILTIAPAAHGQSCPTVCVIIPETVIINTIPRPVPDPAAETAIIHHFVAYGFHVVDQTQVKLLRMSDTDLIERAFKGDPTAIGELLKIASDRFAADVLVIGEAVSTVEVFEALQIPGRPHIQDGRARVEVRAIEARTGRILAAEAKHTGGIDFSPELAGKKSLQRAGDKVACLLAQGIAQNYPFPSKCFKVCRPPTPTLGALPFDNQSGAWVRGLDIGQLLATTTETALSERGCRTAEVLAADFVVTGVITEWKEIATPAINIPGLDWVWRGIVSWMTVDVRVLDLNTAEFKAYHVSVNVSGFEIIGIRFGCSPQDIARAVSKQIAGRIGVLCGRR